MKVVYDAETDTPTITLRDGPVLRESEEERSGVILVSADRILVLRHSRCRRVTR